MNNFLKFIPGFRTGAKWKSIIAIIYYLFSLLMFVGGIGVGVFFLSAPFVVFSLMDVIQHKKKSIPIKKALIPFIISFIVMGIAITNTPDVSTDTDNPTQNIVVQDEVSEDEQEQEALEAVQEAEEEGIKEEEGKKNQQEEAKGKDEVERKSEEIKGKAEEEAASKAEEEKQKEETKNPNKSVEGLLKVHYINVGQGDCALIHTGNTAMLIDAGNRGDGPSIISYIKNQGIQKLDYLILTHPHADHIGGAADVINAFEIDKILMPKASHTSQTFENLLVTIQGKGLKITSPSPGDEYSLGNASFQILASNDGSDLNNKSIVNWLVFGNTSFLFTGDAELSTENKILQRGYNIKSDVLKVGHHGSDTSTSEKFLETISPKHAIISVGENSYGHPTSAVLNRLNDHNVNVYRTDEVGTIVVTSDGSTVTYDKKASDIKESSTSTTTKESTSDSTKKSEATQKVNEKTTKKPTEQPSKTIENGKFVGSSKSDKYHFPGCRHAKRIKSENEVWFNTVDEAIGAGYKPCGTCNPPSQ